MRQRILVAVVSVLLLTTSAFAGKYNPVLDIGDKAPTWENLPGVDGKSYSLKDWKGTKVLVVAFTCNSCPYAVDYEDRMIALQKHYQEQKKSVALIAINVNKIEADRLPKMKERAEEKGFNYPYLYDESQQIAKQYGALYTPEFIVLNEEREVVYLGAMDDSTKAENVEEQYVKAAVEAALGGKAPEVKETPARGCLIRFDRKRRQKPSDQ